MIQIVTGTSFASADKPTNSRAYDRPSGGRIMEGYSRSQHSEDDGGRRQSTEAMYKKS